MSKELQKDDIILPGGLGVVSINGDLREVHSFTANYRKGEHTVTITGKEYARLLDVPKTEDADFEIIEPKQIKNND